MEIVLIKAFTDKPWRSHDTYQMIEKSLKDKWRVHSINTKDPITLFSFIRRLQWEHRKKLFVFNIAEYLDEKTKTGFIPALLDEMDIPHLGSSAQSVEIGLDKAVTKGMLTRNGVPTPPYVVLDNRNTDNNSIARKLEFPLIVKPIREGGHIGIQEDSIVYDDVGLNKIAHRIFELHNQPALVEEFITGERVREFSVGIIDGEIRLFTPIEIDFEAMGMEQDILSYSAAQKDLEKTKLVQKGKIRDEIINLAERTFDIVGASDYSRVDLRMNDSGCYVLEINIMPGLGPHSFLPQAAKDILGLDYSSLILKMVDNSILRQKIQTR